jgi:circadian clock protein KaiB
MSAEGRNEIQLRLFVSGATPGSLKAISILRKLCEARLGDRYTLEITDIYKDPAAARRYQLVALPALFKMSPLPKRLFVGDMRDLRPLIAEFDAFVSS